MSFHKQSFNARFGSMGDEAEGIFEQVYPNGWVRCGLSRPPIQMRKLPTVVRYTPDYLTSDGFIEVKGCGRDQTLKLKVENFNALMFWNQTFQTHLFVWDSHNGRHTQFTLRELQTLIDDPTGLVGLDHFHDGKAFFTVPLGALADNWMSHATTQT